MHRWLCLPLLIHAGCASTPAAPLPREVAPAWGFSGEDTRVDVFGDGLVPELDIKAGQAVGNDLDDAFDVLLKPVGGADVDLEQPLAGVTYQGLGHLSAVVPAGLEAGLYDVWVVTPAGAEGVGEALFTVRDTLVDRVALTVDAVTHEVYSEAAVSVALEDPSGAPVAEDLEVDVTVEGADLTAADVALRTVGLERVVVLEAPAIGVRGWLGEDGVATAFPLLKVPGEFTVRVAPVDVASRVTDDDVVVNWARGSDLSVRVDLPAVPFVARAGEAFDATLTLVDQFGLPAPDAVVTVAVTDACASWGSGVRVSGTATVSVRPTEATGTARCASDRLVVVGAGVTGQSADFQVEAGDHAGFSVLASPSLVTAGGTLNAFVTPVDAWGNTTAWAGSIVTVDDGGGVASFDCEPGAVVVCAVQVVHAGTARTLTLDDGAGHIGTSNAYSVAPATASVLGVVPDAARWVAGTSEFLSFSLFDAFGNTVTDASVDLQDLDVDDPRHEVSCLLVGGRVRCALFSATASTTLTVSVTAQLTPTGEVRLTGESAPVQVVNGGLASAIVVPDAVRVRAGVALGVTVTALDAWDNAYVVRDDDHLVLADTADALAPIALTLDAQGAARTDVVLVRAGRTALVASRGALTLGTSAPIDVDAAEAVSLAVRLDAPWGFVGDALAVRVEALDPYGNRARHDETIRVSSVGGLAPSALLPMFNGLAVGAMTWSASSFSDSVGASSNEGGGLVGVSDPALVARRCAPGPLISVEVGGGSNLACAGADGVAQVSASFGASTPAPGATITTRGLRVAGGSSVFGPATVQGIDVSGDGRHTLRTLVVQDDGCGTEGTAVVWTGPDDGSVVGPVTVSVSPDPLDLDAAPTALVTVSGATTCRGTAAADASVNLRTTRGALPDLSPTGAGLELVLDASGAGLTTLDVGSEPTGGVGLLTAWGSATFGTAPFEVLGDHQLPEVWSQAPKGALTVPTQLLTVEFSEALDPATISTSSVEVQGMVPIQITDFTLSDGGRTLDLALDTALSPSSNGWVLLLGDTISDLHGNLLAGGWDGVPRVYEGLFGVADASDPISACSVDHEVIAPDGDDGAAQHADAVVLSFSSATSPAWWVVDVMAEDGTVVRRHHVPPAARFGVWSWDGCGVDGAVVPDGTYTLSVRAEGARGGLGSACARDVDVAQETGAP